MVGSDKYWIIRFAGVVRYVMDTLDDPYFA
jgi:hypothetical protein